MSEFDVVIHLRRLDDDVPATEAGLALAARLGAHTLGLHVVALSTAAFVSPEAVAVQVNESSHQLEEARQRAPWWSAQLARHGLQGEFQVVQGDAVEALCHAGRWSDLIVAERPCANPDAPVGWGIASRTVFGSSSPVVVVPEGARVDKVGEHMLVAWNASREAMLAIHGAMPLLKRASKVTVLEGEAIASPLGAENLPSLDLRAWLQRRGIVAEFQPFKPEKDHGPHLLEAANKADANLIVVGAWGQSRIAELVLGGVTRHLFQHSNLPMLVAH
ncbi:universal stress protein [Dokdonella immobilis]|uniref:Nucleotide-binding universal stress protein, UspA family n=1 Tax=Dokdonella immobilis TaxID=578942 RepID=A0A1I5A1E0_9GAMM|nr:universal stress protein [Dokdonella immobilis]SFN56069.1 Nucleotide-binding universal stress protein, UspA family [Dokdonella immobilis]